MYTGFVGGSVVKKSTCNAGDVDLITGVQPLDLEGLLEKEMAIHSNIFAWKIPQQRSLVGYSLWGHRRVGHDSLVSN